MRGVIHDLQEVMVQAQQVPNVAFLVVLVRTDPNPDEDIDRVHAFVHAPGGKSLLLDAASSLIAREANPLLRGVP